MGERKEGNVQCLESKGQLQKQEKLATSENLSVSLVSQLMSLIERVNKEEVTPATVNASCNAAAQIYKILHLNFQLKKSGF